MDETEIKLYAFYREKRHSELLLSKAAFHNLMQERGRKVYSKKGVAARLAIKLDGQTEVTIASDKPEGVQSRLLCFSAENSPELNFSTLLCEKFFHHLQSDGERVSMFLAEYRGTLCAVVSSYEATRFNLEFLLSVTRHHFQVNLLFIPENLLGDFDDRCVLAIPCLAAVPFLC